MNARFLCTITALGLTTTLLASCSAAAEPPAENYRGTIRSSCAPHDAPSTELRLESIGGSHWVWFNLWPGERVQLPMVVRFDADHPVGQGAYCVGPDECEAAAWGEVDLIAADPDAEAFLGEWRLGMTDGRVASGSFEAEWLAIQAMCG